MVDLLVAGSPDPLRYELVHPHDKYALVVAPIGYDHFTVARYLLVHTPQEIMVEFVRNGDSETRDPHGLRIDALKDASNSPVFTASIHSLQNYQHLVFMLGIEHPLKLLELLGYSF